MYSSDWRPTLRVHLDEHVPQAQPGRLDTSVPHAAQKRPPLVFGLDAYRGSGKPRRLVREWPVAAVEQQLSIGNCAIGMQLPQQPPKPSKPLVASPTMDGQAQFVNWPQSPQSPCAITMQSANAPSLLSTRPLPMDPLAHVVAPTVPTQRSHGLQLCVGEAWATDEDSSVAVGSNEVGRYLHFAPPEDSSNQKANKESSETQVRRTCKHGHPLQRWVNDRGCSNNCNICGRRGISAPEQIYRCHSCDYDACRQCGDGNEELTVLVVYKGGMLNAFEIRADSRGTAADSLGAMTPRRSTSCPAAPRTWTKVVDTTEKAEDSRMSMASMSGYLSTNADDEPCGENSSSSGSGDTDSDKSMPSEWSRWQQPRKRRGEECNVRARGLRWVAKSACV